MGLKAQDNPMPLVEAPKVGKRVLPSHTGEQLDYLIGQVESVRNKAIISLFADSGLRLSELASIDPRNIDWQTRTIKVTVKGNKEGIAPFGTKTETLLHQWLAEYPPEWHALGHQCFRYCHDVKEAEKEDRFYQPVC